MKPRPMSVKTLARAAGETVETVQLCEREGLFRAAAPEGYGEQALSVLRLVRLGQRLRIPLEEIKAAAGLVGDDRALNGVLRSWAERRLGRIAREQEELRTTQLILLDFLSRSKTRDPQAVDKAAQDLARLHGDLGAGGDPPTGAAGARAPSRQPRPLRADKSRPNGGTPGRNDTDYGEPTGLGIGRDPARAPAQDPFRPART